jgi:hypothetical protein
MAKGDRPVAKLYGKRMTKADQSLPEYLDIAAFWEKDGKLSGMWSRDIVAIKIKTRDGKEHVIKAIGDSYFCNFRDDRAASTLPASVTKRVEKRPPTAADFGADPFVDGDFGDDPIPF